MGENFEEVLTLLKEKMEVFAENRRYFSVFIEDDVMSMTKTITTSDLDIHDDGLCICEDIWVSYPKDGIFQYNELEGCFVLTQGVFSMYIDFSDNDEY